MRDIQDAVCYYIRNKTRQEGIIYDVYRNFAVMAVMNGSMRSDSPLNLSG